MNCGHCVSRVTEAVRSIDAGAKVEVDLPSKTVAVETTADRGKLHEALAQAGYPARAA